MWAFLAQAQGPPEPPSRSESSADGFISRMMAFDENHDGRLTRSEVTDDRLLGLFDRADANHDGVVTKDELKALFIKESAGVGRGGPRGFGGPGRGGPREGFRENGDFGRGGPDMMRPQPGQVLPDFAQRFLNLTPDQRSSLAEIQRDVDTKLDKLLTPAQKVQLKEMGQRGPGSQRSGSHDGPPRL